MSRTLIQNAIIVNEGSLVRGSVLIVNELITGIYPDGTQTPYTENIIDASGMHLFPGLIDDQVHFREPGLTHKADIRSESRAAVAGGITSFMEMPNTVPNTLTQELLEEKYRRAAEVSIANYSFYMGASNDNLDEVLKTDPRKVCGVKVFMGSSTGNMLVDSPDTLNALFRECPMLIATHCEDEATVRHNLAAAQNRYGHAIPPSAHALIRSAEACYKSSSMAVELASKHGTRLHVLHISTARECVLFSTDLPIYLKKITAEACLHHLWFTDADYISKGNSIKWNPSIKSATDRDMVLQAVKDGRIDVIATDHAPHTIEEKSHPYMDCPSGGPLVQHLLPGLLDLYHSNRISLELIAEKTAHAPALCFGLASRGFIRQGYKADLVLVDLNAVQTVTSDNVLYKCGWSPFEGHTFKSSVIKTFVNGHTVYDCGTINDSHIGQRLMFER